MPDQAQRLVISDLTGGRNAIDAPLSPNFGETQAIIMQNVDFYKTTFARRRPGAVASSVTFAAGGPFQRLSSLYRHVPGVDETAAEMWAVDDTPSIARKAGGTTFSVPTVKDAPTGNGWDFSFATLDGKLFIAYKNAATRLAVWDGSTVRRAGLAVPAAPTVANTGAGTYAATVRYYRQRWTVQAAGVTTKRSEPSASVSFTPSGAGTAARVTKAANAGEDETHWELEASVDNVTFYVIATTAIGTTTYDDSAAVASYSGSTLSPATGTYTNQKMYKFIAADQSRLLGFGSWTSTDKQNRVEWSAIVGSLNVGDAERVNTTITSYVDLDEHDSGDPMGLVGPLFGHFYAFKAKQFWELRATGDSARAYQAVPISKSIGAAGPRCYCLGEDALGSPCLYFLSHRGMYQYGRGGLRYIGRGLEDLMVGTDLVNFTDRLYLSAAIVGHMVYHAEKSQVWVWFADGTSTTPTKLVVYHVRQDSWTRYLTDGGATDWIAAARCSAMLPRAFGASMARDLKPYLGSQTANTILQCDADTDNTGDNQAAANFRAYVRTRLYNPWGSGYRGWVGDGLLLAEGASGVTITVQSARDGRQVAAYTKSGTALLTATANEIYASRRIEGIDQSEAEWIQYDIGDSGVGNQLWRLHGFTVPWRRDESIL